MGLLQNVCCCNVRVGVDRSMAYRCSDDSGVAERLPQQAHRTDVVPKTLKFDAFPKQKVCAVLFSRKVTRMGPNSTQCGQRDF